MEQPPGRRAFAYDNLPCRWRPCVEARSVSCRVRERRHRAGVARLAGRMATDKRDLICIGTSAGGVEALKQIASSLPEDLPAAVVVVLHLAPDHRSALPRILSGSGPLPALHPKDQETLAPGRIYVAPP